MVKTSHDMLHDLLHSHGPALRRIARAYAGVDGEAEDLHQEILMQLWRALPGYRGDAAPGTWAYRVALNTALAWRRSTMRRQAHQPASAAPTAVTPAAGRPEAAILDEFMRSLRDVDRTILVLYMEGLGNADIADVVGISAGAVGVRLHRMKQKFETTYVEG